MDNEKTNMTQLRQLLNAMSRQDLSFDDVVELLREMSDADKPFGFFYLKGAAIHMSLKVSKDGKSREEDTTVLKGSMWDEMRAFNTGLPLIDALEDQSEPKRRWHRARGGEIE